MATNGTNTSAVQSGSAIQSGSIEAGSETTLGFNTSDIKGMKLDGDSLQITLKDGSSVTVENFKELAQSNQQIHLQDGENLDTRALFDSLASAADSTTHIAQPAPGQTAEYVLQAGEKYALDFAKDLPGMHLSESNGALVITFADNGTIILKNFHDAQSMANAPHVTFDGQELSMNGFADTIRFIERMEAQNENRNDHDKMADAAQKLAEIEPAAGDGGGAGGSAGGFGFESTFRAAPIIPLADVGPIGPTELQFGLALAREDVGQENIKSQDDDGPAIPVLAVNDAQVYEDGSVTLDITADPHTTNPGVFVSIIISGIPAGWGVNPNGGVYDPAAGTVTYAMPPNTVFHGGPTLSPPADSDADIPNLTVVAVNTDSNTGLHSGSTGHITVTTDAVADVPTVQGDDNTVKEDTPAALNIHGALGHDTDGSETITGYVIHNVPAGFTLNHGTFDSVSGNWNLTPGDLAGLEISSTPHFVGSKNLVVEILTAETNKTDNDFDTTNDTSHAFDELTITWQPVADPPTIKVNNGVDDAQVKEDGSVVVPIEAHHAATASPTEYLVVTVTGIDSTWGFVPPPGGTYDAAHGTWTIQLAPGADLVSAMTFTPPHDSDLDMTGLNATVVAHEPITNTTASANDGFNVITDAVADVPSIDATNGSGNENTAIPVTIFAHTNDTDGSEIITGYKISGVPTGFSFSAGTDNGDHTWSFTPAEVIGLTMNAPANYFGSVGMTATVFNTENPVSDGEFDPTDNNNHADDQFTMTWKPVVNPPDIEVNGGVPDVQVKEDGSVTVSLVAHLGAGHSPNEVLTVVVSGIDSHWGFSSPAAGGVYNAAAGTFTVVLPPGTDLNTVMTFTPPHDSDVDLNNLHATATAFEPATSTSATAVDDFQITTDAVADAPTLTASNETTEEGTSVDLHITTATTDTDGSEVIRNVEISGFPAGATLNHGTYNSGTGVWTLSVADLTGLKVTVPNGSTGDYTIKVVSNSTEDPVSDREYDTTDNDASTTKYLTLHVTPDDVPIITGPGVKVVDETNFATHATLDVSGNLALVTDFGADGPGTFTSTNVFTSSVPLKSNGLDVTVTQVGNDYVGKDSHGATVFTLTLNTGTGVYIYSQQGTLDHPNQADPDDSITLRFGFQANDTDGDHSAGTITIDVKDDGPVAHNDINNFNFDNTHLTATGNVISGLNGGAGAADTQSQDGFGHNTVTKVTYGGVEYTVPAGGSVDVHGAHGTLTMFSDGHYTYTLDSGTGTPGGTSQHHFSESLTFPALSDGQAISGAALNNLGIKDGALSFTGSANGTVTYVADGAGYANSLGMFTIAADGTLVSASFILKNENTANIGDSANFSASAGQELGFFLVADGANTNNYAGLDLAHGTLSFVYKNGTGEERAANVNDDGQFISLVYTNNSTHAETVINGPLYFTTERGSLDNLNADDSVRIVSGLAHSGDDTTLRIGFEDLPGLGDHDYEDIVFDVKYTSGTPVTGDDQFGYTLTDTDGDNSNATLTFHGDHQPVLAGPFEVSTDEEGFRTSTNIHTGGTVVADFGPDAPGHFVSTGTSSSSTPLTSGGQTVTITLEGNNYVGKTPAGDVVFTLTLNGNDGSYTYNQVKQLDHPNTSNPEDNIKITFGFDATDSDGDTAHGTITVNVKDDGPTAIADTASADHVPSISGNVLTNDIAGGDGGKTMVSITYNGLDHLVTGAGVDIVATYGTLHINTNGTYTYTVKPGADGVDHFSYVMRDVDGDTSHTTFDVNVKIDHIPTLVCPPEKTVDETNFPAGNSTGGTLSADFGADAPGSFGTTNIFTASTALKSGGSNVTVTETANGYVGKDASNNTVFTLTLNPTTGAYTYTQVKNLDHPLGGSNHDDNIALHFGVKATDADGDLATTTITINVKDDGPKAVADNISVDHVSSVNGNVLTNDLSGTDGGKTLVSVTFNGVTTAVAAGGSDIVGTYGTLHIGTNGAYTYTVKGGADGTDHFSYVMRDFDGDTSSTSFDVCVKVDRVPQVLNPPEKTVDETNLVSGTITVGDHISADFGTDAPGSFAGVTGGFTATGSIAGGGALKSEGQNVIVALTGNATTATYTGTAHGDTIFTLVLNKATGDYTFKLFGTLDHADGANPNDSIKLAFGFTATDSDGDSTPGAIVINVKDDAPIAHDDHNVFTFDADHLSTTGNVIPGTNGGPGAADTLSQDDVNHVTLVSFGGHSVAVPATGYATIEGTNGTLQIKADGSYIYTLHSSAAGGGTVTETHHFNETKTFPISGLHDGEAINTSEQAYLGVKAGALNTSGTTTGSVKFVYDGAGYDNSLGMFTVAADGTLQSAKLLMKSEDAAHVGDTVNFSATGAAKLGFFIVADGNNENSAFSGIDLEHGSLSFVYKNGTSAERVANVHDDGQYISLVYTNNATHAETVINGPLYFTTERGSADNLNADDSVRVLSGLSQSGDDTSLRIGFEDLPCLGDKDYEDIIFDVKYTSSTTTTSTGATDQFTYTLTDGDGDSSTAILDFNGTLLNPLLIVGTNVGDHTGTPDSYTVGTGHGTITGGATGDILIGDTGGSTLVAQHQDYNVVLVLDTSGSMGDKNNANSRLHLLMDAVKNLLSDFNAYEGGTIKVHVVPFGTASHDEMTFTITNDAEFNAAKTYLNNLSSGGFTNYESALQSSINWLQGGEPLGGDAITTTYFITDGEPNYYLNNSGGTVQNDDIDKSMNQITGVSDGSNEVAILKSLSDEVIGVGINATNSNLAHINVIDSDGHSVNVDDPHDLTAVLRDVSPLNKLTSTGDDTITGGNGHDLIFGDVLNTDALAAAQHLSGAKPGDGWAVFERLEAGQGTDHSWNRASTTAYIRAHAEELAKETLDGSGNHRIGGNDTLSGGEGNDVIFGQEGNDTLRGDAGNDVLAGGSGTDTLYGGAGADTFLFQSIGDGMDTVKDFNKAEGDKLDLSQLLQAYDPIQDSINDFVFARTVGGNTVVSVDQTGNHDVAHAVDVATLENVTVTIEDLHTSGALVG